MQRGSFILIVIDGKLSSYIVWRSRVLLITMRYAAWWRDELRKCSVKDLGGCEDEAHWDVATVVQMCIWDAVTNRKACLSRSAFRARHYCTAGRPINIAQPDEKPFVHCNTSGK